MESIWGERVTPAEEDAVEEILYDFPYYARAIEDAKVRLAELEENIITSGSASLILSSGSKNHHVSDRTGWAAQKLADDPSIRAIRRDLQEYKRRQATVERILSFLEKYDLQDELLFIREYYFKRSRLPTIEKALGLSRSSVLRLKKQVLHRICTLLGWR